MLLRGVPNSRGPRKKGRHLQGGHRQLILRLFPHRILIMTMEEFTVSYAYNFESQVNWQSKENCDLKARREKYHPDWDLGLFFFLHLSTQPLPTPPSQTQTCYTGTFCCCPCSPCFPKGNFLHRLCQNTPTLSFRTVTRWPHQPLPSKKPGITPLQQLVQELIHRSQTSRTVLQTALSPSLIHYFQFVLTLSSIDHIRNVLVIVEFCIS